jgi:hypothetical protein
MQDKPKPTEVSRRKIEAALKENVEQEIPSLFILSIQKTIIDKL